VGANLLAKNFQASQSFSQGELSLKPSVSRLACTGICRDHSRLRIVQTLRKQAKDQSGTTQ
jgi:hypothetical protein